MTQLDLFLAALRDAPGGAVFNPWYAQDPDHDGRADAPVVRLAQLRHYLAARPNPRFLLIAEALGYQGGHFSGMAMTSERILLGHLADRGIRPEHVLPGLAPRRTSAPTVQAKGFNEPTATVVWGALLGHGIPSTDFVLWNAFPWHPFHAARGRLSNRTPTPAELAAGAPLLHQFLAMYPNAVLVAIGRKSEALLAELGASPAVCVRHPANGGAGLFRSQIGTFYQSLT